MNKQDKLKAGLTETAAPAQSALWDLILIRHGMTDANEKRQYCGSTDLPLSGNGRKRLEEIHKSGLYSRWESVCNCLWVTSGMRRTNETMKILFGVGSFDERTPCETAADRRQNPVKKLIEIPALREMDFGRFEGYTYEQLREDASYLKWITGDNERNICPGGESGEQMRSRVLRAFETQICIRVCEPNTAPADSRVDSSDSVYHVSACVAVTHGGPIAAIMEYLFPETGRNRY